VERALRLVGNLLVHPQDLVLEHGFQWRLVVGDSRHWRSLIPSPPSFFAVRIHATSSFFPATCRTSSPKLTGAVVGLEPNLSAGIDSAAAPPR
jgi:hypothetical protein